MNAHDAINNPPQGDSKLTVLDFADGQAKAHGAGYQAGYADAVKAIEVGKPAAAQEAVAWSKTKPTAEGAYYVRGFNLFQLAQYEALVQVRTHHFDGEPAPELVCNIHESTSNADMDDWSPMVDMSDDFEWFGPLFAAPVDDIRALIEQPTMSTPAAPGIDLATVIRYCCEAEQADPDNPDTICINVNDLTAIMQQYVIDASPKGGSTECKPKVTHVRQIIEYLRGKPEWDGKTYDEELAAMLRDLKQATSAEVGG